MNKEQFIKQGIEVETIAAISTPLGAGGIGIVRLSGPLAFQIASTIFRHKGKLKINPNEFKSHKIYYGTILHPDTEIIIDEVMLTVMRKPRTYTKEDIVEINCHGGLLVVKNVLEITLELGAIIAEPGEFTKRAFINGRIDLSQAEAVIDIIESNSERSLKSSIFQLSGGLRNKINDLKNNIIKLNTRIEAPIDFPDQGIPELDRKEIKELLKEYLLEINSLLDTVKYGHLIKEGICCVIIGKTNVGKSSLFNLLLKKNRSIVTSVPGTTRDTIEESVDIKGFRFNLIDTAGMKNPENIVEEISLKRVDDFLEYGQIFIIMFDISQPLDVQDIALINKIKPFINRNNKTILIENKIDLPKRMNTQELYKRLKIKESIKLSVINREGIELLEKRMVDYSLSNISIPEGGLIISNKRHQEYLIKAQERLSYIISKLDTGIQDDFITMDLQYAASQLARITGESCDKEILDNVFSKFCIGK
ncbi:MAG: tRNA uridine-5-carboxymethylaminomethyl(34) synthesis GTPase MnmE [Candidatus Caldatribacteriota bacterium]